MIKPDFSGWKRVDGFDCIVNPEGNESRLLTDKEVQEWMAEGGRPLPADPPPPPPTPLEKVEKRLQADPALRALALLVMEDRALNRQQLLALLSTKSQEAF